MRILTPLWMLPIGLSTLALTGCGQQGEQDTVREQVILATDRAAAANQSSAPLPDEDRVYSRDRQRNGVDIPADFSSAALRQDRLNATIPDLQSVSGPAGPLQKYTIARSLADIYRQDAEYLASKAQQNFVDTRGRLIQAQSYYEELKRVNKSLAQLRGSRAVIIETFRTGEVGGNLPDIDGLDALQQLKQALEGEIEQARTAMQERVRETVSFVEKRQEMDTLNGELSQEAASLQGGDRFEKIDQAIRAWEQARLAEASAETNLTLAKAHFILTGLRVGDVMEPEALQAIYLVMNDARMPEANNRETFRLQMPQAIVAFDKADAAVKTSAFELYRGFKKGDAERADFDRKLATAAALAPDFVAIKQSRDIGRALTAYEGVSEASAKPGTLQAYETLVRNIEHRIAEVRSEIEAAERERQIAETLQSTLASDLNALLTELDAQFEVLSTDRYRAALEAIALAEEQLAGASPTSTLQRVHNMDLAAVYLQHVRIQHDLLLSLQSYQSLLESYLAGDSNGVTILGQSTVDTIQSLAGDLDEPIAELAAEAETSADSLRSTIANHMEQLRAAIGSEGADAQRVEAMNEQFQAFWSNMQDMQP